MDTNNYSLFILSFSLIHYIPHFQMNFSFHFPKFYFHFSFHFLQQIYTPLQKTPQTSIIAEARRDLDIILVCPAGGVFIIVILIFIKVVFFLTTMVSFINTVRMSFFNQQILSYQPYVLRNQLHTMFLYFQTLLLMYKYDILIILIFSIQKKYE